jgi:hypothetical protein
LAIGQAKDGTLELQQTVNSQPAALIYLPYSPEVCCIGRLIRVVRLNVHKIHQGIGKLNCSQEAFAATANEICHFCSYQSRMGKTGNGETAKCNQNLQ